MFVSSTFRDFHGDYNVVARSVPEHLDELVAPLDMRVEIIADGDCSVLGSGDSYWGLIANTLTQSEWEVAGNRGSRRHRDWSNGATE